MRLRCSRSGFISRDHLRSVHSGHLSTTEVSAKVGSECAPRRRVLSWGSGIHGAQGHGHYEASDEPQAIAFFRDLDKNIEQVQCGWSDSLARTVRGDVYRWGWFHDLRTTMSSSMLFKRMPSIIRLLQRSPLKTMGFQNADTMPVHIPQLENCIHISSGAAWSVAITSNGDAYSWGDGFYGQLGSGPSTLLRQPTKIEGLPRIVDAACGSTHTLLLSDEGEVFSCGRLDCFAVGLGSISDHFEDILEVATRPQSLSTWYQRLDRTGDPTMPAVAKVSAGRNISAFLTHSGEVWTCGKNFTGALGFSDFKSRGFPAHLDVFEGERVVDVACGHYHMVAVTESGRVFSWGVGNHGQCGRPYRTGALNRESKANFNSSSADDSLVYTLGPAQLDSIPVGARVCRVEAGIYHSAFITESGECIVVGSESGNRDAYLPQTPFGTDTVHSISFGLSHGIAVCSELTDSNHCSST